MRKRLEIKIFTGKCLENSEVVQVTRVSQIAKILQPLVAGFPFLYEHAMMPR